MRRVVKKQKEVNPSYSTIDWQRIGNGKLRSLEEKKPWYKQDMTNQKDPMEEMNKELDKKIAIATKIKLAEQSGALPKETIKQMKVQAGLIKDEDDEKPDSPEESTQNQALLQIIQDPNSSEDIKGKAIMMLGNKGKSDMATLALLTQRMNVAPKEDDMFTQFMKTKMMRELDQPKPDPLQQIRDTLSIAKELGSPTGGTNPVDEVSKWSEALTKLGVVQSPTGGADQLKYEIEKERLAIEKEVRLEEVKQKSSSNDLLIKAIEMGGEAITAALPSILGGGAAQPKQAPQPPTPQAISCVGNGGNCKETLSVNTEQVYDFDCPKCKQKYQSAGNGEIRPIQDEPKPQG